MNINHLKMTIAVTAVLFSTGMSVRVSEAEGMRQVSGEIGWIDVQLGRLELNKETPAGTKTTAYRITQNETRVTDPSDEMFLGVNDLRAGQHVTIEVVDGPEDQVVPKIIIEPVPASDYQQAFGELKAIDVAAGTFDLEEKVRIGQEEKTRISYFVFDPNDVVVMHSPSKEHVGLALKTGDVVKVEYVERDGKQHARYVTLYSPAVTSTTTTTTTTVTTAR
jgi:hypothetical protein